MKLTVVIVNYNVKYFVEQCLKSLRKALRNIESEVIVVDNHSKDGSVEYLKERFPEVKVISSQHNLGFARANNIAINRSLSEYVLLLNPDTVVGERTIEECVTFMDDHKNAGGVGVMMLKSNGEKALESRRGLPTPMTAFYKMCGLCAKHPKNKKFGKYYMGFLPWDEAAQIEVISGAYCMLRRKAIEQVGLLDEDFFMYGEDIDLSYRLLKGGWENWYLPMPIIHYKGESTQKSSFRYVHVFYEAMLIFFKKHYSAASWWLTIPIKLAIYAKASTALLGMITDKARQMMGFFNVNKTNYSEYVFIGGTEMIIECQQLAEDNGLSARFVEADNDILAKGHQSLEISNDNKTYVVYDTEKFSYEKIMNLFSVEPKKNVEVATYDVKTKVLITSDNIIV